MLKQFEHFFKERNFLQNSNHFLLAVSGGIDSVVLCELSKQADLKFSIAHCNFGLRGEESERDENFARDLADKYKAGIFVKKWDTEKYAAANKFSIQEAARALRYEWFEELRLENQFAFILLAHHADDNIETMLMNFFRGTGLQGLSGMSSVKDKYILRPLLNVRKERIKEFAEKHQLTWVEDSSNASSKYTRNYFRNELIPALKKVYPEAEENLLDNIDRFKKIAALYQISVDKIKREICKQHPLELRIPVKKLMEYRHTSLIYEIIKDYGFGEKAVAEVIKLAEAESGKYIENEYYQIIRHRNWFIIASKVSTSDTIVIEKEKTSVQFSSGSLEIKTISKERFELNKSESVAQVDAKEVEYPLLLRRLKAGDYFYPLGMRKKKKLSRFFIDQKLSKNKKESVWVLESASRIIWVVGMRIDDRFKILPSTKEILQISWTSL